MIKYRIDLYRDNPIDGMPQCITPFQPIRKGMEEGVAYDLCLDLNRELGHTVHDDNLTVTNSPNCKLYFMIEQEGAFRQ